MKTIDTNDWVVVNNIIYKLYAADDMAKMCGQFFQDMKMVLDFDCADFYLADENSRLGSPVFYNCDIDYSDLYNQYSLGSDIAFREKNLVYRESDIIDNEIRKETEIYKEIYNLEKLQIETLSKDVLGRTELAKEAFVDVESEEDRDFLQLFTLVCLLSFDVYMKKNIIESLIDDYTNSLNTEGRTRTKSELKEERKEAKEEAREAKRAAKQKK